MIRPSSKSARGFRLGVMLEAIAWARVHRSLPPVLVTSEVTPSRALTALEGVTSEVASTAWG
jgi:hypothetical protein